MMLWLVQYLGYSFNTSNPKVINDDKFATIGLFNEISTITGLLPHSGDDNLSFTIYGIVQSFTYSITLYILIQNYFKNNW